MVRIGEIETRATIRMGELLVDSAVTGQRQRRGGDRKSKFSKGTLIALSDLGITRKQSHVSQRAASVPRKKREAYIAGSVAAGR